MPDLVEVAGIILPPVAGTVAAPAAIAPSYPPANLGKFQVLGWMAFDQYQALKNSIKAAGRIEVPIVWSSCGAILDGHHRHLAYEQLTAEGIKIEPPTAITMAEMPELETRHYAIRSNCNRRHLSQKEIRAIIKQELIHAPDCADAWLAEICGTTDKTVNKVRLELEAKSEIPTIETFKKRDGKTYRRIFSTSKVSKNKASAILSALESPVGSTTSYNAAKRQKRKEQRARIAAQKFEPLDPSNYKLLACDFKDMVLDEPVDLILTDPLYQKESLQDWIDLAEFAQKNLRDGGILVAYSGLYFLPQVYESLKALDYVWTCAIIHPEGSFVLPLQGRNRWRPVLVYKKGAANIVGVPDTIIGSGSEKEWHDFQQPLPETKFLVEQFSKPGDLICDPFAGSFTTAVAAFETGRRFIGCDLSAGNVAIGHHRIAESAKAMAGDSKLDAA